MSRKQWRRRALNQGLSIALMSHGQTMPIAVVLVIVLVVIGVGALGLITIFGGSNELQNAVDSGNLNVATMSVVGPEVQLTPQQEDQFAGVAVQRKGKFYINLGNINRVWGQTMAAVLNAQMMEKENGQSVYSEQAKAHVKQIYDQATAINRDLTGKLEKPSQELSTAYKSLSGANSLRMVGQTDPTLDGENWNSAFYEQMQKKDSNVFINTSQQFASGAINLPANLFNSNGGYMLGYEPFTLKDPLNQRYDFCFVPLSHEQRPFLVPIQKFTVSKDPNFLSSYNLVGVTSPNSFSYLSKADAPKTDAKLEKVAAGVAKDVTKGFPIQFPRGFIRIDNDPGVGMDPTPGRGLAGLHVIDYLSEQVVTPKYKSLFGAAESPVLAETIFNPLQCKEGFYIPISEYTAYKFIIALAYGFPGRGIVGLTCGPAPLFPPALIIWLFGCAIPIALLNAFFMIYGPELVEDGGLKAAMGHTPAVSHGGPMLHNGVTHEWFSVYASNANGAKLPLMLEGGDTSPVWLGIAIGELFRHDVLQQQTISFLPMDIDIYFTWMFANGMGPDYSSMLEFHPPDNVTSGMKLRLKDNLPVPSLINLNGKKYVVDGCMRDFLASRESNPAVNPYCSAFRRRMRLIKPSADDAELTSILNDGTKIPLGCSAFIFLGDDNKLKVGVANGTRQIGGAPFPSWLAKYMYTQPDPRDPWSFSRYEEGIQESYYRLADPRSDYRSKSKGFDLTVSNDYPSTMQNFDDYIFRPASGYNGLLGALELRSGVKKVCALPGSKTKSGSWDMPENCFIDDGMYQARYGPKE